MKACSKCGSTENGFNRRKGARDGLRSECRRCQSGYHFANRESELKRFREQRDTLRGRPPYVKANSEPLVVESVPVDGWPGYSVTRDGRVYSHRFSIFLSIHGHGRNQEYRSVSLCKDGKQKTHLLHRLVAAAFVPNLNHKPDINHKDTNKSNNYADNLEWCTNDENIQHAIENGLPWSKLLKEEIHEIREKLSTGQRGRDIAKEHRVSEAAISDIKVGNTWVRI